MAKKQINLDIPEALSQKFDAFVERNGYLKWRAIAAAMEVFMCSPPDLRELSMYADHDRLAQGLSAYKFGIVKELEAALDAAKLQEQQPARRQKVGGKR
jgi:hypothetical protein